MPVSLHTDPASWIRIDLSIDAAQEERVATALAACGSLGAWTVSPGLVHAYFPAEATAATERFRAAWRETAGEEWRGELAARRVPDMDWLGRWRATVAPVRVSSTLWVAPPARAGEPPPGARVVVIEPGLGFGTGTHPTTRALLGWLEADPGQRVLDVGCGSGVLAIAALVLGAGRAVGLDVDRDALGNAAGNRDRNAVADRLALVHGDLRAVAARPVFDRVVANLDQAALEDLTAPLVARCASGGRLGIAGLLASEREGFLAGLAGLPLEVLEERTDPDGDDAWWSAWLGRGRER